MVSCRGAGLYTQGAELPMAREQQQQRQAAPRRSLADRRQWASMLFRSQEATTNVLARSPSQPRSGWMGVLCPCTRS